MTESRRADQKVYLWTTLWCVWFPGTSRCSRGFSPREGVRHAGSMPPFERSAEAEPFLTEAEVARIDERFERVARVLAEHDVSLAIVATESDAKTLGGDYYVYYEPAADVVFVVDPFAHDVSIWASEQRWDALSSELTALSERTKTRLRQGRVVDALLEGLGRSCELFLRDAERTRSTVVERPSGSRYDHLAGYGSSAREDLGRARVVVPSAGDDDPSST